MMYVCPELSSPKPLDQSKNVTVRSYHKLPKDQNGSKKLPKSRQNHQIGKKLPKWPKVPIGPWRHVAKPGEVRRSVVTIFSYKYSINPIIFIRLLCMGRSKVCLFNKWHLFWKKYSRHVKTDKYCQNSVKECDN